MSFDSFGNQSFTQKGWQCPVCKIIHAPWVPSCHCQSKPSKTTDSSNGAEVVKSYEPTTDVYRAQGYSEEV